MPGVMKDFAWHLQGYAKAVIIKSNVCISRKRMHSGKMASALRHMMEVHGRIHGAQEYTGEYTRVRVHGRIHWNTRYPRESSAVRTYVNMYGYMFHLVSFVSTNSN
eukprot:scaffold469550_cov24-Prasinocladus_malaysianus.AAC.1